MDKTRKVLLMCSMLLCSVMAKAYDFEVNGMLFNVISEEEMTCEVTYDDKTGIPCYNGDVIVPSSVEYNGNTYSVVRIGERAFGANRGVASVQIPETIMSIGDYAFAETGITEVVLPASVKMIEAWAFRYCNNLKSATISAVPNIMEPCVFEYCSSLESVRLPEGLETLPSYTFRGCQNLQYVNIPSTVTHIDQQAFYNCYRLKSITLPKLLATMDEDVFYSCMSLESVTMLSLTPPILESNNIFLGCDALKTIYVPLGAAGAYDVEPWNLYQIVEQDMTSIGAVAVGDKASWNVYDLDGRVVKRNATNLDGLKHGIYIVNGKKIRR